jgi:hypothetical protein
MPRKIVIVAVGVILAILAFSFFATGYDLGGKPLVIHEERYVSGYHVGFIDNYELKQDTWNGETVALVNKRNLDDQILLPAYDNWKDAHDAEKNMEWGMTVSWNPDLTEKVIVGVPEKYTLRYPLYETRQTKLYPGDFYTLSILCLIGLSFLAMYAAFTSRKE